LNSLKFWFSCLAVPRYDGNWGRDGLFTLSAVVFEDALALGPQLSETAAVLDAGGEASENSTDVDARVATLKQELWSKEEYLQTTNEELAADPLPGSAEHTADKMRLPLLFRGYRVDDRVTPVKFWKESSIDAATGIRWLPEY
jgi:hypothetical protein